MLHLTFLQWLIKNQFHLLKKKAQEEQAKEDEKTKKDSTSKSTENKSLGKTTKSTGLHNKKINTAKAKRGLVAQKTKQ